MITDPNIAFVLAKRGVKGGYVPCGDKSISHRALMLAAINRGTTVIRNLNLCDDVMSTIECLRKLTVEVEFDEQSNKCIVCSSGYTAIENLPVILNAGNSGTTMRLLTGLLSAFRGNYVITGDSSLCSRPMKRIIDPLTNMGAKIHYREGGLAPLSINGSKSLAGIRHRMHVASAQVKSAILLAAIHAYNDTIIEEPYMTRDHTEKMLKAFGVDIATIKKKGLSVIELKEVKELCGDRLLTIPGDFSNSFAFIALTTLIPNSSLVIKNVGLNESRITAMTVLKEMGANIEYIEYGTYVDTEPVGEILIKSANKLQGREIEHMYIPQLIDEIPLLALVATQAEGETRFINCGELIHKESNRLEEIKNVLTLMGADVRIKTVNNEVDLIINGRTSLHGCQLYSEDHRIVIMSIIASLIAHGSTKVDRDKCVNISDPDFFKSLRFLLGGNE